MAQPAYKWSDVEALYNAVVVHGTITAGARSFLPPMSAKTAANQYEAAISRFGKPDIRKHHRAAAVAYDPDNPPECELTLKITHLNATAVAFSDAHWTSLHQPRSLEHSAVRRPGRRVQLSVEGDAPSAEHEDTVKAVEQVKVRV